MRPKFDHQYLYQVTYNSCKSSCRASHTIFWLYWAVVPTDTCTFLEIKKKIVFKFKKKCKAKVSSCYLSVFKSVLYLHSSVLSLYTVLLLGVTSLAL